MHIQSTLPPVSSGWLLEQLTIQAEGLSGYLSLFWDDVMNSSWIGGNGDTGLHERTPYWLNGFVPLAYQLNNATLIDMVSVRATLRVCSLVRGVTVLGVLCMGTVSIRVWIKFNPLHVALRMAT